MANSSYGIGLVGPYTCVLSKKNSSCACRPQSVASFFGCLRFVSLFFLVESSGALLRRYFSYLSLSTGIMTDDTQRDQRRDWDRRDFFSNLDFFSKRLDFSISPNKGRRRLPVDPEADGNAQAWRRI